LGDLFRLFYPAQRSLCRGSEEAFLWFPYLVCLVAQEGGVRIPGADAVDMHLLWTVIDGHRLGHIHLSVKSILKRAAMLVLPVPFALA